jgi:hypothetical protein
MVSKNIEDLRDKELQPQLEELIGRYWFSIQFAQYIHAATHWTLCGMSLVLVFAVG